MKNRVSGSLAETAEIARDFLAELEHQKNGETVVVGLSGHLGAGKTTFTQALAKKLGVDETVTSPTFVIMKPYETKHPRWKKLYHVDAYRLEKPEELEALRFESLQGDAANLIVVEWPENVSLKKSIPGIIEVRFEIKDGKHHITF